MNISITAESIFKMKEFYFLLYILLINLYGISIMVIDKKKAGNNKWRIRERNLFITAILGGAAGMMMGMIMFHHKTQHTSFTYGVPLIFVFNILLGSSLFYWIYIG